MLQENNKSLWMNRLAHTLPYPGRSQDWNQRLLPLQRYNEYQARMNRLLETRIAVLLELSRRTYEAAIAIAPGRPLPSLAALTALLRAEAHAAWHTTLAPTLAEFQREQIKSRRPLQRLLAAVSPQRRDSGSADYAQAAQAVARHGLTGPPAAAAWREYQQVQAREAASYDRQVMARRLTGAGLCRKLTASRRHAG